MRRTLEECREIIEKNYVEIFLEELEPEERAEAERWTPEKLKKEAHPFDFDVILEIYPDFKFTRCEDYPVTKEGLKVLKAHHPDIYDKVADKCWVLDDEVAWGGKLDFTDAYTSPLLLDGERIANIYIKGIFAKHFTPEETASVMLHEGLHLAIDEDPEKYGINVKYYGMEKMFGLVEDRVNQEVLKSPLAPHVSTRRAKLDKIVDRWIRGTPEERLVRIVYVEEPYMRLHTCMTGKPAPMVELE